MLEELLRSLIEFLREPLGLIPFLRVVVNFLDEINIFILLLFVAISAKNVGHFRGSDIEWEVRSRWLSRFLMLLYGIHLLGPMDLRHDVIGTVVVIIRVLLVGETLFVAVALPMVFGYEHSLRYCRLKLQQMRERSIRIEREYEKSLKRSEPVIVLPAEPSRQVRVREAADQAKLDFEFECDIIRSSNLEKREEQAGLMQAKQKYLQRLSEAVS